MPTPGSAGSVPENLNLFPEPGSKSEETSKKQLSKDSILSLYGSQTPQMATQGRVHLVAIMDVNNENDLMIINKSGITIRTSVDQIPIQGRATQGVRIINLGKKNDCIGSVCKVTHEAENEEAVENTEVTEGGNSVETENNQ